LQSSNYSSEAHATETNDKPAVGPSLPDADLTTLTSSRTTESSVIQLLSPIEKNRPFLKSYKPVDISDFLARFRDYRRQGGTFSLSLCLSATQLSRFYHPSPIPPSPSDEEVRQRVLRTLPKWQPESVESYLRENVAMRYPKAGGKSAFYNFSDSDFLNHYNRFVHFLDQFHLYWEKLGEIKAFLERNYESSKLFSKNVRKP
jgi:hypothetical protein